MMVVTSLPDRFTPEEPLVPIGGPQSRSGRCAVEEYRESNPGRFTRSYTFTIRPELTQHNPQNKLH
jgi:hypothetical protein